MLRGAIQLLLITAFVFFFSKMALSSTPPCGSLDMEGRRHSNGGGFVAATAFVHPKAFVGPKVEVCESAEVHLGAIVIGQTILAGNAYVGAYEEVGHLTEPRFYFGDEVSR